MGQYLLVRLSDDLATRSSVWRAIKSISGVHSVTDLRAITMDTLAVLLMSDEEYRAGMDLHQHLSPQNLIRRYWQRIRQPRLPDC